MTPRRKESSITSAVGGSEAPDPQRRLDDLGAVVVNLFSVAPLLTEPHQSNATFDSSGLL